MTFQTDPKPPRRPSRAGTIGAVIIVTIIVASLFIPLGVWLTRLALGG
jgi:hypothetical protein